MLDVPPEASRVTFGALLVGGGQMWADEFVIDVVDASVESTTMEMPYFFPQQEWANVRARWAGEPVTNEPWIRRATGRAKVSAVRLPNSRRRQKCGSAYEPLPHLTSVEARGFEPRSENRSTTVSTCVSRRLRSPTTGQRAAHRRTSLLRFRPTPEGVTPDYPDIAIPAAPPRAGFNSGHEHNAYALRCERQFSVGDCVFSRVFYQDSGPGHATAASLSPSKPSRPRKRTVI